MTMLDTPEQIHNARLLTLRAAINLELRGLKLSSKPRSATQMARGLLGITTRSRLEVLRKLEDYIEENIMPLQKRYTASFSEKRITM